MFTIDSRANEKGATELAQDKRNIIQAITAITGLKHYYMVDQYKNGITNIEGKNVALKFEAYIVDSPMVNYQSDIIKIYKKAKLFRNPEPVEDLYVMSYGDVVYIKDETNMIYVHVKGKLVLKKRFDRRVDLWKFSLHVQDSLKNHEFKQFKRDLKKDKMFWENTEII